MLPSPLLFAPNYEMSIDVLIPALLMNRQSRLMNYRDDVLPLKL
jgi:hypothetical protein